MAPTVILIELLLCTGMGRYFSERVINRGRVARAVITMPSVHPSTLGLFLEDRMTQVDLTKEKTGLDHLEIELELHPL